MQFMDSGAPGQARRLSAALRTGKFLLDGLFPNCIHGFHM